jgi:hypothetical protein
MAHLYGHAERLTAKNGGFRPGRAENLTKQWAAPEGAAVHSLHDAAWGCRKTATESVRKYGI